MPIPTPDVDLRGQPTRFLQRPEVAWLVLIIALACTLFVWQISRSRIEERAENRFRTHAQEAARVIATRMQAYEELLRGGVALIESGGGNVDAGAWHRYVSMLDVGTLFPGIQGIGFARMLRPGDIAAHEHEQRARGLAEYAVAPPGERERYAVITWLEPLDVRNRRALGFDMFSDPVRRAAMEQARDTGQPALSGRVTLVQENGVDEQSGFLMYLPVYRPDTAPQTLAERRAALLGFVYAPFRAGDLMRSILAGGPAGMELELVDAPDGEPGQLLYGSLPKLPNTSGQPRFMRTVTFDVGGRTWNAHFRSVPDFETSMESDQPRFILIGGALFALVLFFAFRAVVRESRKVRERADDVTRNLRETATRLQLAQDTAHLGLWERNLQTGAIIWNARMFELCDVRPGEFDGHDDVWRGKVHPEDLEQLIARRDEVLRKGGRFSTTYRLFARDGSIRHLEAQGAVIRGEDGMPERMIGITRDVTEQVVAEQARAAERERLQAIIDCIPEVVALKDAQLVYRAVNPAAATFLGRRPEECTGRNDSELFKEAEANSLRTQDMKVLATGETLHFDDCITGATGPRWVEVTKAPLREKDGSIKGVLVTARDVSALRLAKEQLGLEHAALEAVFGSTHALIAVLDRSLRLVRVNAAFCAAFHGSRESFIGKSAWEVFPDTANVRLFAQVVESGSPVSVSGAPLAHAERGDTWWDCTLSPLTHDGGLVVGVVLTAIDSTEREGQRRKVEQIWAQARAELEERVRERTREWENANRKLAIANHELESFSYSVSHDLRAPLRAINGFTLALKEDYDALLDETGREYIARVHAATVRMGELIDGMLNLARVFRSPISPRRVDLSAMAREQAELSRGDDAGRQVRVEIEPGLLAIADESLLRVLFQNLFDNAWKFTSRRSEPVISFGCMVKGGRRIFYVRDNGIGFEMEYAGKLFKPFERLHDADEYEGTGIGLATVRRIVQRHGGEVWGEGVPDHGATIYFTLETERADAVAA